MPFNPFEEEAGSTPFNPFADTEAKPAEKRGALSEIGNQLRAGAVVELPQMIGQAAQYASNPGDMLYGWGKDIADAAAERGKLPENAPVDESQHGMVVNALAGGARMIPQSIAPAAAVGTAALASPFEVPAGLALLGGAALSSLPAAMSQGQQTLDKAKEAGVDDETAKKAARLTALIEGGGETLGTAAMGKVFGIASKAVGGKTAGDLLRGRVSPEVLKPWAKATAEAYPTEILTEMGQNAGETAVENAYGIDKVNTPWDQAKQAIAPTAGMTTLMAPFGLAGHATNARQIKHQSDALSSADTPADIRSQLAQSIVADMHQVDPAAAAQFAENAANAIANKQAFPLDENALKPGNGVTAQDINTSLDTSGQAARDFVNEIPSDQRLLPAPDRVITAPAPDGGTTTIDRAAGPISDAAADAVTGSAASEMADPKNKLLRSYANNQEAQSYIDSQDNADELRIIPHPVSGSKGRVAVVQKSAQEIAALREAKARDQQIKDEEGSTPKETEKAPETPKATMPKGDAEVTGAALASDKSQEELAPISAQPVTSLPGVKKSNEEKAAAAKAAAEARGAQIVDEEASTANPSPSEAQINAGNYQKGHVKVGPLDISIENPAGSERTGTENGKVWKTKMKDHYGYVKRTEGADGDQVDVYVKQGTASDHTGPVYVVDQFNPKTGRFDEHKAMIGYGSRAEAEKAYDAHFSDKSGPKRRGATTEMAAPAFKAWAQNGDTTRPASEARSAAEAAQDEIAQSTGKESKRRKGETQEQYHQRAADESNARKQQRSAPAEKAMPTEAADLATARSIAGDDVSIVRGKDMPDAGQGPTHEISKQSARFIRQIAHLFGKRVVFVDGMEQGGFYSQGNTIFLAKSGSIQHLRVFGHEMLHALKAQHGETYTKMLEAVGNLLTPEEYRAQFKDYFYNDQEKGAWSDEQIDKWLESQANKDFLAEEWMADLSGNRFAEGSFWSDVFTQVEGKYGSEKAKGIIAKLRLAIVDVLNKLMALVKGDKFAVDARMGDHLEEIRKALATGFADYAKAVKDKQVDLGEGETKFARGPDNKTLPTRWPTSKKLSPSVDDNMITDLDTLKQDPKQYAKAVEAILEEPGMHSPGMAEGSVDDKAEHVIKRMVSNLLWLYDQVPQAIRERSKLWYDGARKIAEHWAQKYDITESQAAGALAVLSPQKDWFMNVTMAERVLDIIHTQMNHRFDARMDAAAFGFLTKDSIKEDEDAKKNLKAYESVKGKTLAEVAKHHDLRQMSVWIRAYDEAYHDAKHAIVTPEGGFVEDKTTVKGEPTLRAWGDFTTPGKAASIYLDGTAENINKQLGGEHKVRNFYNNIFAPGDSRFTTIDTHAVAADMLRPLAGADMLRPLAGADKPVAENFGKTGGTNATGLSGTYALHYEAYRQAAEARGVLPREMQSITWEAVRGLFTEGYKGKKENTAHIDGIWRQVDEGKLTVDQAREQIVEHAGGLVHPDWWNEGNAEYKAVLRDTTYVKERAAFGGAKMTFEVAPDPRNKEQKARWDALSADQKQEISHKVAWKIVAKALASFGDENMKGELHLQMGGFENDSNPSLSVWFNKRAAGSKIAELTRIVGYALNQKSMMRTSPRPFDTGRVDEAGKKIKSLEMGAVRIYLPEGFTNAQISELYSELRTITGKRNKPLVGGHTTADGVMIILNHEPWSGVSDEALTQRIGDRLHGRYDVDLATLHADFPEKGKDNYGLRTKARELGRLRQEAPEPSLRARSDQLRAESGALLDQLIGDAEQGKFSTRRSDAAGDERAGGRDAATNAQSEGYGQPASGAVSVVGRHYSAQERNSLDGRYYGTGASGREADRIRSAHDPRLKERIYFYVNAGKGITPEQGVGSHAHDLKLNNVYDANADTWLQKKLDRNLPEEEMLNAFESAVIDSGFDGYVSDFGSQRAAVLLGRHSVKPQYVGQNPAEAPGAASPIAKSAPTNTAADQVAAAKTLPSGKMSGADWKKMVPLVVKDADVSMLEDGKYYYKDQVVQAMRGEAKLSPARRQDYQWEQTIHAPGGGLEFLNKDFAFLPSFKINQGDDDFATGGFAHNGLMGHRAFATEGADTWVYGVTDRSGSVPLALVVLDVKDGKPVAIHDMESYVKGRGFGSQIVASLAANTTDPIKVVDILGQSEKFWENLGASKDFNGNGQLDWQTAAAELGRRSVGDAQESLGGAANEGPHQPEGFGSREEADGSITLFSPKRAADEIRAYAQHNPDSFFKTPKTDAKTVEAIGREIAPDTQVVGIQNIDPGADRTWIVRTQGEDKNGKHFMRDAYIFQKNRAVWVNVAGLESGDAGGRVYQIAGAYAKNNDLKLVGDPFGITEAGKRRRLENMIALALKYGGTDFIEPHDNMLKGKGFGGLRWFPKGDNLPFMLQASRNVVEQLYPEIKHVSFNFDTGKFERDGTVLGDRAFDLMAAGLRRRLGADAAGAPGSGTLRLAALYASLVSREDQGRGLEVLPSDSPGRAESVRTSLEGLRYSPQRRFYSQLERSFEQAKFQSMTGSGWKQWLVANSAKLGIKQDEIQWAGVTDWLDLQGKAKVSKADVANYLKQNGVKVEEVEKGKAGFDEDNPQLPEGSGLSVDEEGRERYPFRVVTRDGDVMGYGATEDEAIYDAHSGHPEYWESASSTKYHSYALPGGENYRELLLTLPESEHPMAKEIRGLGITKDLREVSGADVRRAGGTDEQADRWMDSFDGKRFGSTFQSSHWDEPNILAHVRFNDRTDADGNKVLFIEELQSDWGQQGKKEGFQLEDPAQAERRRGAAKAAADRLLAGRSIIDLSQAEKEEWNRLQGEASAAVSPNKGVPAAPFVTDTKSWLSLGLKRMIAYAVENGYDKVAFVNGEQSADRYDLSKQVDVIYAGMAADGKYLIGADKGRERDIINKKVGREELPDLVGKELAEKIVKDVTDEDTNAEYRGLDLKVGGSGMKAFYDQIVPQVTRDVLKKLGGGQVENIKISVPSEAVSKEDINSGRLTYPKGWDGGDLHMDQPGFTLTPALKEKVGQGMPLFSTRRIVGDSGRDYDQSDRDFFQRVGRDIDQQSMVEKTLNYLKKDFGKKMAIGIVDQFRGLKDLGPGGMQAYLLARLSKGTAGAFDALLHHGKLSLKGNVYDADTTGGVVDRLGIPLNGELDDMLWWVAANRAEKLAAEGKENLFTPEDIAAGKRLNRGTTGWDYTIQTGPQKGTVTRDRATIYADAQRVFNEFNKNTMDMAEQSGLIDKASRKYWENEFYVPFYRVSEEDNEFIGNKIGSALVRQRAFHKLKGGSDKLNSDLLSNTLLNWSHLIEASAKNRAAKASLVAAQAVGVAHPVAQSMVEFNQANGSMLPPGTKHTVWFMDNGQKREYKVDDPFVMTAITSLEYAGMNNPGMKALSAFKHFLTVGVTASPAFKVRNLIRDSIQAIGTSDLGYNPLKNIAQGWKQTNRESQEYVSALASGALIRFGTMLEGSESARTRQLIKAGVKDSTILDNEGKVRAFYDRYLEPAIAAYNEIGNRGEEINRAALYNQLIKDGKSHAEAALMARDLMDFSMQGSFNTIRFLTQVVPFLNARLQGLYKLGRASQEDPARLAIVLGATTLLGLSLMAAYHDDDDWKRRTDSDVENYWWFKFGGIAFRIPRPFEIGAVAALAERGVQRFTDSEMTNARLLERVKQVLMGQLSMNPVPQMIKPLIDIYSNKDSFTGMPIETMGMEKLQPDYRFTQKTSMVARGISTAGQSITGLAGVDFASPVQLDHLVQAYFSWLGTFVVGGADMLIRPLTNEPVRPTGDIWKTATQGFVSEVPTMQSRYVGQMYEQAKKLEEAHGTWRQMIKEGKIEEAKAFREDNAEALRLYPQVEAVKHAESKFNGLIRMIENNRNMTPDEKKERILAIRLQEDQMARRVAPGYMPQQGSVTVP